jgi:hypothetical protein
MAHCSIVTRICRFIGLGILSAEVPRADLALDVGGPVEHLTDAAVVSYAPICIHVQGILNACTRLEVKRS